MKTADEMIPTLVRAGGRRYDFFMKLHRLHYFTAFAFIVAMLLSARPARAVVLWSSPGPITVHENGAGKDVLAGAVSRTAKDSGALYFKFRVNPISDVSKEEYYGGFQLFEDDTERFGVGNSQKAWAYSAFNTEETGEYNKVFGDFDLRSANPESYEPGKFLSYELPRQGIVRTIVFKVQFIPGNNALVTVWMEPDLTPGTTEDSQLTLLTTQFRAKATFNQIRLRHGGGGEGWTFSDMAIATSFDDFIVRPVWQQGWFVTSVAMFLLIVVATIVRVVEKKKFKLQLQRAEQQHALERERGRIAMDLHDELGSSLTQISLLGGLLRAEKDNPAQVEIHAAKLADAADASVRALEEIVWAVRPGSDTLQGLLDYVAHFANELFVGDAIRCRQDLPANLPVRALPPDVRHNIFLIVKEALNNVLKHAGGKVVQLQVKLDGDKLRIIIADDGKGFSPATTVANGGHSGLENMKQRAQALGGELNVTSELGKGARVELAVNLPA